MTYLQPVLDRAGAARSEFSQGQVALDAIMDEYKFELIGEGHDSWHVRRRGIQYFKDKTLTHNSSFGKKVGVKVKIC